MEIIGALYSKKTVASPKAKGLYTQRKEQGEHIIQQAENTEESESSLRQKDTFPSSMFKIQSCL